MFLTIAVSKINRGSGKCVDTYSEKQLGCLLRKSELDVNWICKVLR